MKKLILSTLLVLTLAGCGGSPLSLLTGGGPNVAANVQAGQTNSQTLGQNTTNNLKLVRPRARSIEQSTGETSVRTEHVDSITVNTVPKWIVWALCLAAGALIPSVFEWRRLLSSVLRWERDN